jgi:hypothetical protein
VLGGMAVSSLGNDPMIHGEAAHGQKDLRSLFDERA